MAYNSGSKVEIYFVDGGVEEFTFLSKTESYCLVTDSDGHTLLVPYANVKYIVGN
ncbi:hypothetical protein [Peribacillus alkalitolerans]|uniref:hypothetical protein n=1 Tax=Peribacillus alkalitolerans TaxID=1550385 RepID=UPI0013D2A015|nr:hypothetical protein [Peribacillus alkalitolerans]